MGLFSHEVVVPRVVVVGVVIPEVVVLSPRRLDSATVIGGIINTQNLSPHISLCKGCGH